MVIWLSGKQQTHTNTQSQPPSPPESVYFQMSPHSLSSFLLSIGLLQDVNAERIQSTSPRDPKRRSLPTSPSQPHPGLAEEVGRCSTWNILKLLTYTYPQVSKPWEKVDAFNLTPTPGTCPKEETAACFRWLPARIDTTLKNAWITVDAH